MPRTMLHDTLSAAYCHQSFIFVLRPHLLQCIYVAPPRILVSAALVDGNDTKSLNAIMAALRVLGAEPVLLANHSDLVTRYGSIEKAVKEKTIEADGVVIMGNNQDIDPAKYNAALDPRTIVEKDRIRAAFEETLILHALEKKLPLLGICGGMQRINVLLGGTLRQHKDGHHQDKKPGFEGSHPLHFLPNTKLHTLAGEGAVDNSFHHQAVQDVGKGLRVNAMAEDGTIEGIESDPHGLLPSHYIMGVQWHPEFGASPASAAVINDLVTHARNHVQANPPPTLTTPPTIQRNSAREYRQSV